MRLTDTSNAVLALIEQCEPVTPYQLKRVAQATILHFWSVPHTQIYAECARLAGGGLLDEQREETGRRRRLYQLSDAGRAALTAWRQDVEADPYELRDPGLLKLFAGADPLALAAAQLEQHERRLAAYRAMHSDGGQLPARVRLSLECGIGHAEEYVRFWERVGRGESTP